MAKRKALPDEIANRPPCKGCDVCMTVHEGKLYARVGRKWICAKCYREGRR